MAVDSSWLTSSNLVGYGILGSTNQPTLPSFNSSLLPPLRIPSSDPTLPNLGLIFNFNSEFVPFCSTKPLLFFSSVPPILLQFHNLPLFQTLILLLHGDDVYFTLENSLQDGVQHWEGGVLSKIRDKRDLLIEKEKRRLEVEDKLQMGMQRNHIVVLILKDACLFIHEVHIRLRRLFSFIGNIVSIGVAVAAIFYCHLNILNHFDTLATGLL